MKIAIVGFATEGKASYEYFQGKGHEITICDYDVNIDIPKNAKSQLGTNWDKDLYKFDLVVRSAGINPAKILKNNPSIQSKITTAINEFLKICPTKNVIGVTGTKGKGTTSTLITRILEENGQSVFLGGNIGKSPLEFLDKIDEKSWVVLELSSFQLCDIKYSPYIMTCLMVVPEHLDWHIDIDDYINAKKQAFAHQTKKDIAIYFAGKGLSESIASASPGKIIPYFEQPGAYIQSGNVVIDQKIICNEKDIKLLGKHNQQNICAAITTVWEAGFKNIDPIYKVLKVFGGLKMRLEMISDIEGVRFYNDSFGTTPETATVAIKSFNQPIILIVGGSDKGIAFDKLAYVISNSTVKAIIAIGETGPTIANLVREKSDDIQIIEGLTDMDEIVSTAHRLSTPGDIVLLSCGSASFGLFKNYKDRGEKFDRAVKALENK